MFRLLLLVILLARLNACRALYLPQPRYRDLWKALHLTFTFSQLTVLRRGNSLHVYDHTVE